MPTPDEIKQEQIRREIARRKGQPAQEDPLLYKIPGMKAADQWLESKLGPAPSDTDPNGSTVSDIARVGVDAASLGGADYMAGGNQKQLTDEARKRLGWAGTATDLGAGTVSPIALPKKIMAGGRLAKAGWNAGEAGVQGIIDAYTHNPDASWTDLAKAGATSSGLSAGVGAIAEPIASWFSRRKSRQEILDNLPYKTKDDLSTASKAHYASVKSSGAVYTGRDTANLVKALNDLKFTKGYDKSAIVLRNEILRDHFSKGNDISLDDLDKVRQYIREKSGPSATGGQMLDAIDAFQGNTTAYRPPSAAGQPYTAAPEVYDTQKEARRLHMQREKMKLVDDAEREAARKVAIGRGNPFAPSPEASDVREFSKISKASDTGKRTLTDLEDAQVKKLEVGTPLRNIGQTLEPYSFRGKFGGPLLAAGGALGFFPAVGHATLGTLGLGALGAEGVSAAGRKATANQIDDLRSIIADPKGVGTTAAKADKQSVLRDRLKAARLAASAGRTYTNRGKQ